VTVFKLFLNKNKDLAMAPDPILTGTPNSSSNYAITKDTIP